MNSRTDILARLRQTELDIPPLPDLTGAFIQFPDREKQFSEVLAFVGGRAVVVPTRAELAEAVAQVPWLASAKKVVCTVPGLEFGNCDLNSVADPHELADLDVAILTGDFAVAENAAVWITDRGLRQRVVCFITQHLVLVVPRAEIVEHLHQGYDRLTFDSAGYGLWMSGPSKTADIEQSLVIGAHGPRSLTVFLVGD